MDTCFGYKVADMNAIQPNPEGPKALRKRRKRLRRVLREQCGPWNLVLLEKQRKLVILTFEFLSHDIAVHLAHAWVVSIISTWLASCFDKYRANGDIDRVFYEMEVTFDYLTDKLTSLGLLECCEHLELLYAQRTTKVCLDYQVSLLMSGSSNICYKV